MEADNERVVWVRCHGIPVHAWNSEFFAALARNFGVFLGVDENTRKKTSMDVARILVRTKYYDVFNMVVHANINGSLFFIKVFEEWCGPMHWNGLTQARQEDSDEESSGEEDDSENGDGPPLFTAEDSDMGGSGEEEEDERPIGLNAITLFEGSALNFGEEANHDVGKVMRENEESKHSVNEAAHEGNVSYGEYQQALLNSVERIGRGEVKGLICEVVEDRVDDCGPGNGGLLKETFDCSEDSGPSDKAQNVEASLNYVGPREELKGEGLQRSVSTGDIKVIKKAKLRKKKKNKEGQSSNCPGADVGITIGLVNEEGRKLIPSLDNSVSTLPRSGGGACATHLSHSSRSQSTTKKERRLLGKFLLGTRRLNDTMKGI